MNFLKGILHSYHANGLGMKMRTRRHTFFLKLLQSIPNPINILDVGGNELYWQTMGFTGSSRIRITLLNLNKENISSANMQSIVGNAIDLKELKDQSFEIVFSNSVIEHVGDFEAQRGMAKEVMRIGKRYFIQTPNYWFPMEPHFLFPGFQWFPVSMRVWLVRHFDLGWYDKISDPEQARDLINHNRLLTKQEFKKLFPQAKLHEEKIFGLVKSFIAYDGWDGK
jgi:2-polyprenyl-3-methyl-5-hydroxy-6-metoxy-1,4-benzoquinol methylase